MMFTVNRDVGLRLVVAKSEVRIQEHKLATRGFICTSVLYDLVTLSRPPNRGPTTESSVADEQTMLPGHSLEQLKMLAVRRADELEGSGRGAGSGNAS
jgi:hypothetical protein